MPKAAQLERQPQRTIDAVRALADQAFSRAAGAPLIEGNSVRLLIDATQNYPAWLAAIDAAQHHIHFESYIIHEDDIGRKFADALIVKAQAGVRVRLVYDWMGGFGKASHKFWNRLREAGVEVRCYNPPRFDSPFGWVSRDHRKMIAVDSEVGYITGLCVGRMWVGDPHKKLEPWRDTGIEVRGPAVEAIEHAFAQIWAMMGSPLPEEEVTGQRSTNGSAGDISMRVVATIPATTGLFRFDQLVTAIARRQKAHRRHAGVLQKLLFYVATKADRRADRESNTIARAVENGIEHIHTNEISSCTDSQVFGQVPVNPPAETIEDNRVLGFRVGTQEVVYQ